MIFNLPDMRHSETGSSGLYQEKYLDSEEIFQSELGSLVASGLFVFFVFVFVDCTDTSYDLVVEHTVGVVVADADVVDETVAVVALVVVDVVVDMSFGIVEEAAVVDDQTVVAVEKVVVFVVDMVFVVVEEAAVVVVVVVVVSELAVVVDKAVVFVDETVVVVNEAVVVVVGVSWAAL